MIDKRKQIEDFILKALESINHEIVPKLKENIHLFSIQELIQIGEYLNTGRLNTIYDFFSDKQKELKNILTNIKMTDNQKKLKEIKIQEKLEISKNNPELILLDF